jgi:hypothetical protein
LRQGHAGCTARRFRPRRTGVCVSLSHPVRPARPCQRVYGRIQTLQGGKLERRSPTVAPGCGGAASDWRANDTKSPRREPGDTGSNTSPRAMHCEFEAGCHVWS